MPEISVCTYHLKVILRSLAGFSLEIYNQMMHNTIGRYETPSLHTAIEMLSGNSNCCGQDLESDLNGALA